MKYNIYIIEDKNDKAHALIGSNMNERQADRREETGWGRIDQMNFSIRVVEVGSKRDKKYTKEL